MVKLILTPVICFSAFYCFPQSCEDSLKTTADYDAAIGFHDGQGTAFNNYGTLSSLAAFLIPGVSQGFNGNRALIHFDLSSIPANSTITAAYLDMYAHYPLGTLPGHQQTSNNDFCFQRVTSPWTESTVTWSTQPSATSANQATVTGTGTYSLDYLHMDVTNLISAIHSSANNYGVLLRLVNETASNAITFCSEDHPILAKRPCLRVYYCRPVDVEVGVPEWNGNAKVTIAPNPFSGAVDLTIGDYAGGHYEFLVYDITGKVVYRQSDLRRKNHFVTADLEPGLYFGRVMLNSEVISIKKLIRR